MIKIQQQQSKRKIIKTLNLPSQVPCLAKFKVLSYCPKCPSKTVHDS